MEAIKGLKNLHYAIATVGEDKTVTYATPVAIDNLQELSLDVDVSTEKYYADDGVAHIENSFNGCKAQVILLGMESSAEIALKGAKVDAQGVVVETDIDEPPYIALGFQAKKANGEYKFVWLALGKMKPNSEKYKSKGEKTELQSVTLDFEFDARDDGKWRFKIDSDATNAPDDLETKWFAKVYDGTAWA